MELLSSLEQFRFHPVHQYNYICTSMGRFGVCVHHFLKLNFSFRCEYKRHFWLLWISLQSSKTLKLYSSLSADSKNVFIVFRWQKHLRKRRTHAKQIISLLAKKVGSQKIHLLSFKSQTILLTIAIKQYIVDYTVKC